MATQVIIDPVVTFDGTDISAWIESAEVTVEADDVDFTNAASNGNKERKAGLQDGKVTLLLQQDYAVGKIDQMMWEAFVARAIKSIGVKANDAPASASNPEYVANYVITNHSPISGKVGEKAGMTLTFPRTGGTTRKVA